ncbi:MAG TPA: GNAT family N-acetyltransferase, partial [Terriglobales bacterium]|nr:GNAT family N-acetyltransferase [Terriglobales bacterium]
VLINLRKPKFSQILTARSRGKTFGALRLATKKPWAINTAYFTAVDRPLYLTGMAVHPDHQRKGIGCLLLKEAEFLAPDGRPTRSASMPLTQMPEPAASMQRADIGKSRA